MPTAADARKIKQEIAILKTEQEALVREVRSLKREKEEKEAAHEAFVKEARAQIQRIYDTAVQQQRHLNQEVAAATVQRDELESEIQSLLRTRNLITADISRAEAYEAPDQTSYLRSVIAALQAQLAGLVATTAATEEEADKLAEQKRSFEVATARLEEDKAALEAEIQRLGMELAQVDSQHAKKKARLLAAQQQLDAIAKREHDSIVMMRRLEPEYRQVYESLPNRRRRALPDATN